jgi:hypothetical protein
MDARVKRRAGDLSVKEGEVCDGRQLKPYLAKLKKGEERKGQTNMLSRRIFLCRLAPPLPRPFPPKTTKRGEKGQQLDAKRNIKRTEEERTFSSSGHCSCVV